MTDQDRDATEVDRTVERIDGRLHSVRSTFDDSGQVVQQILTPLMVEFRFQDVCEIVIGASVMAIPIAFTEEVWRLGEALPWPNVIAVAVVSVVTVALFVYFIFYKDHLRGHVLQYVSRTVACYGLALLVVAFILTMFDKCPWQSDPATAIRRIILVGYPACYGATVLDSLR